MSETKKCPCCPRNCDLANPHCERGEEYLRTGEIPQHHSHNAEESVRYHAMDTDNKLIINLRDASHVIRFLFEGKGSQKRILIILNEADTITQRELTERLGIKPGSASEVIGKLEDAGLIERTPSEADRRTIDIKLTEKGKAQAQEAVLQRKKRHEDMFSCLCDEEKETLLTLLEKVNKDWKRKYSESEEMHHHHKPHKEHDGRKDHKEHGHHGHRHKGIFGK